MAVHKHAAVLRAIADGKTVQTRFKTSVKNAPWFDYDVEDPNQLEIPHDSSNVEWRVKPTTKKVIGWVNVYSHNGDSFGDIYKTKQQAIDRAGKCYVDTIEISHTWEE